MKLVIAILGGLCLSVITFVAGLVISAGYFSAEAEKQHLTGNQILWTDQPVRVNTAAINLERVPGIAVAEDMVATAADDQMSRTLDRAVTGAIAPRTLAEPEEPQLSEAHLDWCSSRYRSYRPRDNSYTPFSGGRRECVSPFTQQAANPQTEEVNPISPAPSSSDSFEAEEDSLNALPAEMAMNDGGEDVVDAEHVASCAARYRSYRVEDNTYQPYGGGARRLCQ